MRWLNSFSRLGMPVKLFLIFSIFVNFGIGLVAPVTLVFAKELLGLSAANASLFVSVTALGSLMGHYLIGVIADKASKVLATIVGIAFAFCGSLFYFSAHNLIFVIFGAFVSGLGLGTSTGWFSLLSSIISEGDEGFAFSVNHLGVNIGIGLGAAVSGIFLKIGSVDFYRYLFLGRGFGYLLLVFPLIYCKRHFITQSVKLRNSMESLSARDERIPTNFSWMKRTFFAVFIVFILYMFGYSQLDSGFLAAVISKDNLPLWVPSLIFTFNTAAVVLINVYLSPRLKENEEGLASTLGMVPLLWAISWGISSLALLLNGLSSVIILVFGVSLFSLGEVYYSFAFPLLTALAFPKEFSGRGFGVMNISSGVAFIVGPAVSSFFLKRFSGAAMMIVLAFPLLILFFQLKHKRIEVEKDECLIV